MTIPPRDPKSSPRPLVERQLLVKLESCVTERTERTRVVLNGTPSTPGAACSASGRAGACGRPDWSRGRSSPEAPLLTEGSQARGISRSLGTDGRRIGSPVNTRSLLLVGLLLPAGAALAATPAKTPKPSRVRITRAEPRPLPSLGQDPALRGNSAAGYAAVPIGESARRYTGEPISLDLKDADIRDVLLTFSRLARLNMVIDPDVRGSVTVRLEDVPWDQALEVILKVNGLGYVSGDIVPVGAPPSL